MASTRRGLFGNNRVMDAMMINIDIYCEKDQCNPVELAEALKKAWNFRRPFWLEGRYHDQHYRDYIPRKRTTKSIVDGIFEALWEYFGEHVDACISTTRYPKGPLHWRDKIEEDWIIDEDDLNYQIWKETYDARQRRLARQR